MTTRRIISGSRLISLLMAHVWFNFNRIFNGFEFILSIRNVFRYCYSLYNPEKLKIFKNGKMLIKIINYHNDSEKPRKLSRSRMTKQTAPLNSYHEI